MRGLGTLALLAMLVAATAAGAHGLRLFAAVDGAGEIAGHAFFVGGGRPAGARLVISDGAGTRIDEIRTGPDGTFGWTPPAPGDFRLTVETGDGHVAQTDIAASRFGGGRFGAGNAQEPHTALADEVPAMPDASGAEMQRLVAAAVRDEMAPILARIEALDARMRFADMLSGIFFILGLAGAALWAAPRLKAARRGGPPPGAAPAVRDAGDDA